MQAAVVAVVGVAEQVVQASAAEVENGLLLLLVAVL
jgi:hypothetical protein